MRNAQVYLSLIVLFATSAMAQPGGPARYDVGVTGVEARRLFEQLRTEPKKTSRKSTHKKVESTNGSIIECETFEDGQTYCVLTLVGFSDKQSR